MNLTFLYGSFEPLLYGVIIFAGLFSVWYKVTRSMWAAAGIEVFIFVLVFKLHGGTMNGGFAATVAALLAGLVFPMLLPSRKK